MDPSYALRRNNGSLFGLISKHQILVDLPNVDRLMSHSSIFLDTTPIQYTLLTRVFGGLDLIHLRKKVDTSWTDLKAPVEKLFLNETASTAALERVRIPEQVNLFVTFTSEIHRMRLWEQSAQIRIKTTHDPGDTPTVEANLQSLTRDFGACIAIPQLYGKDFLTQYPQVLQDMWKFDTDLFPWLMIGIPQWAPFQNLKDGLAARTRMLKQIESLYYRIHQYQLGHSIDFGADMSDISTTALDRNKVYERDGWSYSERGASDFAILWAQNANTQPVLFWLLAYVYSTSGILEQLRMEIAPYISVSEASPSKLASLDIPGLCRSCQLLKACIFETYRLVNEPTSIRYVARPITITDGDLKHEIEPGTFVSVPHSLANRDPSVYDDPNRFEPARFLAPDAVSGELIARHRRLKPWGSGAAMCKGRTFAEKEIMALGAAIISIWNIAPASGTWELPAMVPGTGVRKPVKDIRVKITRRS
jgi:cytochrome P450